MHQGQPESRWLNDEPQWEYCFLSVNTLQFFHPDDPSRRAVERTVSLNSPADRRRLMAELAEDGWELVPRRSGTASEQGLYFRRPVPALALVWERCDVMAPVDLPVPYDALGAVPPRLRKRVEQLVFVELKRAELEGWHPDDPTDFEQLWRNGQIRTTRRPHPLFGPYATAYTIESVTLRLKRLVLAAPVGAEQRAR